jgi:hypothetical protein
MSTCRRRPGDDQAGRRADKDGSIRALTTPIERILADCESVSGARRKESCFLLSYGGCIFFVCKNGPYTQSAENIPRLHSNSREHCPQHFIGRQACIISGHILSSGLCTLATPRLCDRSIVQEPVQASLADWLLNCMLPAVRAAPDSDTQQRYVLHCSSACVS